MRHRQARHFLLIFGVAVVLLLSGCGLLSLDENSGQLRELIQRNKENWEKGDIESYRFAYNKTIGATERDSVRVTVLEGQIDTVSVDGAAVENLGSYLTINRLYDEIIRNFERDDRGQFRIQFNEEFSYPERYRMAAGEQTRGRGVVVTSFTVLDGPDTNARQP